VGGVGGGGGGGVGGGWGLVGVWGGGGWGGDGGVGCGVGGGRHSRHPLHGVRSCLGRRFDRLIEPLAGRVAGFGWHLQIHMRAASPLKKKQPRSSRMASCWHRPSDTGRSIIGRPEPSCPRRSIIALSKIIRAMLYKGNTWMNPRVPTLILKVGVATLCRQDPGHHSYIKAAPGGGWCGGFGTWPHPTERTSQ